MAKVRRSPKKEARDIVTRWRDDYGPRITPSEYEFLVGDIAAALSLKDEELATFAFESGAAAGGTIRDLRAENASLRGALDSALRLASVPERVQDAEWQAEYDRLVAFERSLAPITEA